MIASVLDRFQKTNLGKRLLGELEAEEQQQKDRAAAAKRLELARKQQAAETPGIEKELPGLAEAMQAEHERHQAEMYKLQARNTALLNRAVILDMAVGREEVLLKNSCSPIIGAFLATELPRLQSETHAALQATDDRGWKKSDSQPGYEEKFRVVKSNRVAVDRRVAAIRKAREEAEALKLLPIDEPEVQKHLDRIRASIPGEDTLRELTEVK
jgi:hypothetical protein